MAIVLKVGGVTATYDGAVWQSNDADADIVLDTLNDMMTEPPGPSGADPYPALTRTREIARRLGGHIVDEGQAPEITLGVVY